MKDLFAWLLDALRSLLTGILEAIAAIGDTVIQTVVTVLVALIPSLDTTVIDGYLANINYVAPLEEAVAMGTVWAGVYIALIVYRLVKSWIPTVSGS